jgi:hypothetical protein
MPLLGDLPAGEEVLEELRTQYSYAYRTLVPPMNLPMAWLQPQDRIPLIARRGQNRSDYLRQRLGIGMDKRLVLFYAGPVHLPAVFWAQIRANSEYAFLFYDMPPGAPELPNMIVLPPGLVHPSEVVPSMDLVLAKAGYGIASECMANGVPLIYAHRADFLESTAISRELEEWGGAVCLAPEVLLEGKELAPFLNYAYGLGASARPVVSTGADYCAELLAGGLEPIEE